MHWTTRTYPVRIGARFKVFFEERPDGRSLSSGEPGAEHGRERTPVEEFDRSSLDPRVSMQPREGPSACTAVELSRSRGREIERDELHFRHLLHRVSKSFPAEPALLDPSEGKSVPPKVRRVVDVHTARSDPSSRAGGPSRRHWYRSPPGGHIRSGWRSRSPHPHRVRAVSERAGRTVPSGRRRRSGGHDRAPSVDRSNRTATSDARSPPVNTVADRDRASWTIRSIRSSASESIRGPTWSTSPAPGPTTSARARSESARANRSAMPSLTINRLDAVQTCPE